MKVFILAVLFVLPCLSLGATKRIINGEVIELGNWPFLVSLHFLQPDSYTNNTKMKHVCGGSLIDPYWVLTAAHCISGSEEINWKVVLAEHNQYLTDEGEQTLDIAQIIPHPYFNITANLLFDVALLRLKTAAELTKYVGTIDLNYEENLEGTECEVGGWGQSFYEPYGWGMYIPLKTKVTVVNTESCARAYKVSSYMQVDESTLCATYPVNGALPSGMHVNSPCIGDSGGPLIYDTGLRLQKAKRLAGIVRGGYKCGDLKFPGTYTNVAYYTPWIEDVIHEYQPFVKFQTTHCFDLTEINFTLLPVQAIGAIVGK